MTTKNIMKEQAEKKSFAGVANHFQGDGENYPGWQELVALANGSGNATVWTGAVYKGDVFECELGSSPFIKHVPGENHGVNPDDLISTYACLKIPMSITPIIEVFSRAKILSHQEKFVPKDAEHYSYSFFEAYARKLPLLEVLKYVKKSPDLKRHLDADAVAEGLPWTRKEGDSSSDFEQKTKPEQADHSIPDPYADLCGGGSESPFLASVPPDTSKMDGGNDEFEDLL